MKQQHESFLPPDNHDVPIWRYMDITKFVWMLQNRALYFCQLLAMDDPFEGHYTEGMAGAEEAFVKDWFPPENESNEAKVKRDEAARKNFRFMLDHIKNMKQTMYINCWHMNEDDSLAMWKLYTPHGESIALRSTYRKLAQALPEQCYFGRVHYIDYRTAMFDMFQTFNFVVRKRRSFEHERELRAVIWDPSVANLGVRPVPFKKVNDNRGMVVPVDLLEIAEQVYISPSAKPPFFEVVRQLLQTYGLEKVDVKQSEVNAPPAF